MKECVCRIFGSVVWPVSARWLRRPIQGGLSYQQSVAVKSRVYNRRHLDMGFAGTIRAYLAI